jgi:Ca2+:H+ antiporter
LAAEALVQSTTRELGKFITESWLNVLLVFFPISLILDVLGLSPVVVFGAAAISIIPLAGLIGEATQEVTERVGPGIGGLLNATFGNATELVIAIFALRAGLQAVVKASITGSILANILLVLGLSMLVGGWNRETQKFNRTAAGANVAMLMLAVTALVMPALWDLIVSGNLGTNARVESLSLLVSLVLLATYGASLLFSLRTHRSILAPVNPTESGHAWISHHSLPSAVIVMVVATILMAIGAEVLVGSIRPATQSLGLTQLFVGVVVVAIVGNAAEQFTAMKAAARGQMDLAFHVPISASTQISLLIAPILVILSVFIGQPMDLVFHPLEILGLALAVLSVAVVSLDGESNWFEGIQLTAVYLVLAIAFFFVP